MLVADGGTIGVYEFPLFDQFVRVNGTALAEPFVVTALVEPVATPTATPTEVPEEPTATPTEAPEEPTATPTEAPEEPTATPTEDAAGEGEQTPVAVATPDGVPASGVHLSGNSFTLPTVLGVLTGLIAAVYAARRRR